MKKFDKRDVIDFWFEELKPKDRFVKSKDLDRQMKERFASLHSSASHGELFTWRETGEGRLAEIIVLDQFSRNIFRDLPKSFSSDTMAIVLAQEAVHHNADSSLPAVKRSFLYMPYMHSESAAIHEEAVRLFAQPGLEQSYEYEIKHKAIIDRFGRYPHRNAILGRKSTPEEVEFLKLPGSSF